MTDLLWQNYRKYPLIPTLFPGMAPSTIWVARRKGDTLTRIHRTQANDWETVVVAQHGLDRTGPLELMSRQRVGFCSNA